MNNKEFNSDPMGIISLSRQCSNSSRFSIYPSIMMWRTGDMTERPTLLYFNLPMQLQLRPFQYRRLRDWRKSGDIRKPAVKEVIYITRKTLFGTWKWAAVLGEAVAGTRGAIWGGATVFVICHEFRKSSELLLCYKETIIGIQKEL